MRVHCRACPRHPTCWCGCRGKRKADVLAVEAETNLVVASATTRITEADGSKAKVTSVVAEETVEERGECRSTSTRSSACTVKSCRCLSKCMPCSGIQRLYAPSQARGPLCENAVMERGESAHVAQAGSDSREFKVALPRSLPSRRSD